MPTVIRAEDKDCEWCGQRPSVWRFPCSPFTLKGPAFEQVYRGDWSACETCMPMVDEARWDELGRHADLPRGTPKRLRAALLVEVVKGWEKFAGNRPAPAVRTAETDVFLDPIVRRG